MNVMQGDNAANQEEPPQPDGRPIEPMGRRPSRDCRNCYRPPWPPVPAPVICPVVAPPLPPARRPECERQCRVALDLLISLCERYRVTDGARRAACFAAGNNVVATVTPACRNNFCNSQFDPWFPLFMSFVWSYMHHKTCWNYSKSLLLILLRRVRDVGGIK